MRPDEALRHPSDNREFHRILLGSFLFYMVLILFLHRLPLNLKPQAAPVSSPPRKITMVITPPIVKPKPLPVLPAPPRPPVPIVPKQAKKVEPPPAPQKKKEAPLPPVESPEVIEKRRQEMEALKKARELEKNREVAKNKFSSLFGNTTEEVIRTKGLDVITTHKPSPNMVKKGSPGGTAPLDFQIAPGGIDQILKNLPSGGDKKGPLLGEHQTKMLSNLSGANGSDGSGPAGSARTPEDFERVFKAYEGRLKAFYDKTIQSQPDLKGIMVVRILLAPDGHVIKCNVLSSGLKDPGFESEITRIIQEQFKFSQIVKGEEYYDRALNFHPIK